MRVNFVLPFLNNTGGLRVVFEHANRLTARGHEVRLYVPRVPYRWGAHPNRPRPWYRWARDLLRNLGAGSEVPWFDLAAPPRWVWRVDARSVEPADATVATAWPTAYWVARLGPRAGRGFYFVQHYETWNSPLERVDGSYALPLAKLVIASWLERLMRERFGQPVLATITNGVNPEHWYPEGSPPEGPPTVLMQHHHEEWKGCADGYRALEQVRRELPGLRLRVFGMSSRGVPPWAEAHVNPPSAEIRRLYSTSHVFLSPSWIEGCQLPPMEAMACGCAVVATRVGGIPDYAVAGETALVCEPKRPDELARAVLALLGDAERRRRLARRGREHIAGFTWDRATDRFERALREGTGS
jgi:glycosyltransferase involved in cell wall biosynthesis